MIETLSQFGELAGGLGALFALIYLALQIRQNNVIARAQARQTLIENWSSGTWDLARDGQLLASFAAGLRDWPDIPDDQKTQFDLGMSRFAENLRNGLLLHEANLLDQAVLEEISTYMVISVMSPGGRRWWNETSMVNPAVRAFVDERLRREGASLVSIDKALPYWMTMASDRNGVSTSEDLP